MAALLIATGLLLVAPHGNAQLPRPESPTGASRIGELERRLEAKEAELEERRRRLEKRAARVLQLEREAEERRARERAEELAREEAALAEQERKLAEQERRMAERERAARLQREEEARLAREEAALAEQERELAERERLAREAEPGRVSQCANVFWDAETLAKYFPGHTWTGTSGSVLWREFYRLGRELRDPNGNLILNDRGEPYNVWYGQFWRQGVRLRDAEGGWYLDGNKYCVCSGTCEYAECRRVRYLGNCTGGQPDPQYWTWNSDGTRRSKITSIERGDKRTR